MAITKRRRILDAQRRARAAREKDLPEAPASSGLPPGAACAERADRGTSKGENMARRLGTLTINIAASRRAPQPGGLDRLADQPCPAHRSRSHRLNGSAHRIPVDGEADLTARPSALCNEGRRTGSPLLLSCFSSETTIISKSKQA